MLIAFAAYDSNNSPLAGLTPTWLATFDAETGTAASEPSIEEISGGAYKFELPVDVADFCGTIDLGATATPRYLHVEAFLNTTFAAFDGDGVPLTGLTPTWSLLKDVSTEADLPLPSFSELGDGIYKFETPANAVGLIAVGGTASPAYLSFSSAVDDVQPVVITGVTPPEPSHVFRNTIVEFDLDDSQTLSLFILIVSSRNGDSVCEVAYDSLNGFRGKYRNTRSTTNGTHFTVWRTGGWSFPPKFEFVPVLSTGNLGVVDDA
jgi:hypothetical protein